MMKLLPSETVLTGSWFVQNGQTLKDATCERIEWLTSHQLRKIAESAQLGAWETLYRDPDDGRYWERIYPQGEMQGGGPPQLRCLSVEETAQKFGTHVINA